MNRPFKAHLMVFGPEKAVIPPCRRYRKPSPASAGLWRATSKGCFDNIDHHILVNILKRRIKDEAFIDPDLEAARAGYLEDWMKHQTYSGTPQGSG